MLAAGCLGDPSTDKPTTRHFDPTKRPPNKPSAVTIYYYCDIPSQGGRIVRPPQIVTF
jgi:hypothetical protein